MDREIAKLNAAELQERPRAAPKAAKLRDLGSVTPTKEEVLEEFRRPICGRFGWVAWPISGATARTIVPRPSNS